MIPRQRSALLSLKIFLPWANTLPLASDRPSSIPSVLHVYLEHLFRLNVYGCTLIGLHAESTDGCGEQEKLGNKQGRLWDASFLAARLECGNYENTHRLNEWGSRVQIHYEFTCRHRRWTYRRLIGGRSQFAYPLVTAVDVRWDFFLCKANYSLTQDRQ